MERNLSLYPWLRVSSDIQAWIPVFFLYFSQFVTLEEVIQLSAVYYASVFLLEVPSGYFSDRIGRKITLSISACAAVVAHSLFLIGGSFLVLAMGQFMLAASIAFQSGTDTALHYDSLAALDRTSEYEQREARAEKFGLTSLAIATLLGGALGAIDLRFAYILSLLGGIGTLFIVFRLSEPLHHEPQLGSFLSTLESCLKCLRQPVLAWIFCAMVMMYAMEHVPFEFYQPYIRLLDLSEHNWVGDTSALISGIVISVSMFGGVIGAAISVRARQVAGLAGVLGLAALVQLSIVSALGLVLHAGALAMVFVRNFPMALIHAPVYAAIAPLISSNQRATYLSFQGLCQRIFFAILLFSVSIAIGDSARIDWATLSAVLRLFIGLGLAGILTLAIFRPRLL